MLLLQWRTAFTHCRFYLFADPSDRYRHSTCTKRTLHNGRLADGLSYERKALGVIRQAIALTLYNLGNEMSLACGWLLQTWGK